MKRLLLLLCALAVVTSGSALALPGGPEPDASGGRNIFEINVKVGDGPSFQESAVVEKQVTVFDMTQGWDFGDRPAYRCAWVEYFQGTDLKFELSYKLVSDYTGHAEINDRYGQQVVNEGVKELCWNPNVPASPENGNVGNPFFADGTDHFPHMIHPGDGIDFYQNGEVIRHLELSQPECAKLYFVPGDEPGEVWLWWDEDGPTFSHGEGEGELGCGGGPLEAVSLVRLIPRFADPDIGYCTVSAHEQQCFNVEPPPTPVQLGDGRSVLTCPDGSTPVLESTEPLVVACA